MGVFSGPKEITSNMILCFDPASSKCYTPTENLLKYSESFDQQSAWGTSSTGNITANTSNVIAPDGTNNADFFYENSLNSTHFIRQYNYGLTNLTYTTSVYAKAGGRNVFTLVFYNDVAVYRSAHFNLSTGTVTNGSVSAAGSASITSVGNNWYLCSVTAEFPVPGANYYVDYRLSDTTSPSNAGSTYTGDGVSGIYFWGAQIVTGGDLKPYTKSTTANISASTSVVDLSNNRNTGTLQPNVSCNGTTFNMNANSNSDPNYITIPQITFADRSTYTLDFWVKQTAGSSSSFNGLGGKGTTEPWVLFYCNNSTGLNWYFRFRDVGSVYTDFSTITTINIQTWTNIVLTLDTYRNASLYLNGDYIETKTLPTSSLMYISRIGGGYESTTALHPLQGVIGPVKFYTITLTPEEVKINFDAIRGRYSI